MPLSYPTSSSALWPNFYMVGTVKGGTTSLYRHLQQHPDVFLPAFKEPHFFAQIQPRANRKLLIESIEDEADYLKLYRSALKFSAVGDASTSNLWYPEVPERIHQVAPDAKIIIMLRDPVARAHSHYLMDFREGIVDQPLSVELLKRDFEQREKGWGISRMYVDLGLYADPVQRYFQTFGASNVQILQFDELVRAPEDTLQRVAQHLGIAFEPFLQMDLNTVHNAYKAPRGKWSRRCAASPLARWIGYRLMPRNLQWWLYQHLILKSSSKPQLDPAVRHYLESIYAADVLKLESLLNQELPSLRASWSISEHISHV
ncbi:sulfotransferase family protein [Acidithiobacillus thiooxidans]|uniref:Sulfotransferase n=1 Tax=Acidithiobacillus thiooxidans ATCC 19377 TaxID=637390 RepID=A0A543Q580_ACITH|nr:sulfotransferase [Acidithiobacillus thiooxidans]MDX5934404.1 sulfotransferase [Acidithiobacillus thiooxidans]TQN51481.1 hypothetical protein DLNHIDIE_01354 [Acidithiobacillus thiooxidans ATCC 19377]